MLARTCASSPGMLMPAPPCPPSTSGRIRLVSSRTCVVRSLGTGSGSPEPTSSSSVTRPDRFTTAALRLKNLLSSAGDGEGELVDKVVKELGVGERIQMQITAAAAITVTAVIISQLSGVDPWGGIDISAETGKAALVGALGAIPLVALRAWCWSPKARKEFDSMEDMHQGQLEIVSPWFSHVSQPQLALMMALDILPLLLLVLPAAQGSICAFVGMIDMAMSVPPGQAPLPSWGMDESEQLAAAAAAEPDIFLRLGALSLTALVMSSSRGGQLDASEEEEDVVATAVENADRYYRVSSANIEEARSRASAFKAVARAYLETKNETAMLAGAFMALDVFYLGGLWYGTHNLAAPLVAALASNWVDYYNLHSIIRQGEEKVRAHGSSSEDSKKNGV